MVSVKFSKSDNKNKKMKAVFYDNDNNKIKTTHFGSAGYSDFTIHKDNDRKQRYLARHSKTENWNDYKSAGSLAKHILWSEPTVAKSIKQYKAKFNLK